VASDDVQIIWLGFPLVVALYKLGDGDPSCSCRGEWIENARKFLCGVARVTLAGFLCKTWAGSRRVKKHMNVQTLAVLVTILPALIGLQAAAGDSVRRVDTHVSILYGGTMEVDPTPRVTATLEQVRSWSIGDLYWFVDSLHYTRDDRYGHRSSWYGEISPRLSLGKTMDRVISTGLIKHVLIAATYERGGDTEVNEAALIGPGFDLALPGLRYFQANFYARKDLHQGDWDTWQCWPEDAR
jgi:hypothetical protein